MCVEDDCTNNTLQFAEGSPINRDINSRLAAIGFAWGKLKPVATRGPMLTFNGINSPPELQLGNGTIGQQFEYLVDRSIRVTNKTDICLNRFHPNTLLFTSCDTPFSTWTFHTHTHQLIEESSLSCLTHSGDGKVTLEKCESNGTALFYQTWDFTYEYRNLNYFLYNVSVDSVEHGKKQTWRHGVKIRELSCPIFNDILLWGKIECKTKSQQIGCISLRRNHTVILETCNSQSSQQFMMMSDYTIRPYGTDDCLITFTGSEEIYVQPCNRKISLWEIIEPAQQLVHYRGYCLTVTEQKTVILDRCNANNNQTWKFGHINEQTTKKPLYLADMVVYWIKVPLPNSKIPTIPQIISITRSKRETKTNTTVKPPPSTIQTPSATTKTTEYKYKIK